MLLIQQIWKKQPGKYFCISTKKGKVWKDNWFTKDQFNELEGFIKDSLSGNVYFCPHGFSQKSRLKDYAVPPKLLYADLDAADPKEVALKPTIALESSPGRYVGFWLVDEPIKEELNRRLSYSIGADVSGWDFSQVLRVPNTKNYKYPSTPRVKILWNDGPTYEVKRLNRVVPRMKNVMGQELDEKAPEIFKRHEKKLPRWVRRELLNGKPEQGKRSEVIWRLQNELIEVGLSRDEVFELIWACPWNKFRDRRDGPDQLWRELDKALDQHFSGYKPKKDDEDGDPMAFNPLSQSMADVVMRNITWIVPGMYARGEITIVEGDPGLGKSYFQQVVCAALVDGKKIPCETDYEPVKGKVAYFDTENTADTVTKLRLIENGCENLDDYFQEEYPFSIDDEEKWEKVEEALEKFKPDMIVFDTINIYIGGADTYKSSETQQALSHFKVLAARHGCSVVLLRHLTKASGSKALYRGQGSIAFTGVARIVLTVGLSPDDQEIRVVACTKNNIGPKIRSFTYRIIGLPDKGDTKNRSKLMWGEFVDLTADDIVSVAPIKSNNKDTALKWLTSALPVGKAIEKSKLDRMGAARGFKNTDLDQAAEQLGVKKTKRGDREFWEKRSGDETPNKAESHGSKHRPKSTVRSVRF